MRNKGIGCAAALFLLMAGWFAPGRAEVVEEIIAQVNDRIIVLSEYQRSLESTRQELSQQASGMELQAFIDERSKDVLRDLIDQQLLIQKGADLGMSVETDVIRRLDEIRRQMKLDSMEALEQAVLQQGMSYEDFKQNLADNILTQRVISREVGSHVNVPPDDVKVYYEAHKQEFEAQEGVHIQQILISTEEKEEAELPEIEKRAQEVLAKAREGDDFAELAQQYSDDATAASGGNAGFFEKGMMAPEIESVIYSLEKGKVSDLVRTRYGFMIFKLLERTEEGIPPMAAVQNRIFERLYYDKVQPALREYLTTLRGESYLSIKEGYVDSGAAPAQQASTSQP